ncbi:hypothetical protein [Streptomyces sp. NPDC101165]|uniref:hypothetical protein n=1 Tax=Streptomyces sp. NPDC101165 TaxID=3366119 RepID=UPI0037FC8614
MAQQSATRDRTAAPVGYGSVFLSFAPWIVFTALVFFAVICAPVRAVTFTRRSPESQRGPALAS